jgi:hypothetical protein
MPTVSTFVFDPSRPILRVNETRLNRVLLNDPHRCATISEYAGATGIPVEQVMDLFGDALDAGYLAVEIWGDEMFLMTSPSGRPGPSNSPQVAPNLWEVLRENAPIEHAYALWRLVRGLQAAGWTVEISAPRILFGLGPLRSRPYIGVRVGSSVVPVLVLPSPTQLAASDGLLAEYERAGAAGLAVVCEAGALDEMVTAVRRWVLARAYQPSMSVLLLESPRFNPTLLSPDDAAVLPKAVSRVSVEQHGWDANLHSDSQRDQIGDGPNDGGYGWR